MADSVSTWRGYQLNDGYHGFTLNVGDIVHIGGFPPVPNPAQNFRNTSLWRPAIADDPEHTSHGIVREIHPASACGVEISTGPGTSEERTASYLVIELWGWWIREPAHDRGNPSDTVWLSQTVPGDTDNYAPGAGPAGGSGINQQLGVVYSEDEWLRISDHVPQLF